ncbi:MAG: hypothetical protein ACK40Z_05710 [Dietzia sp.]
MSRRTIAALALTAATAVTLAGAGSGIAGADPITDSLEALPSAVIGGPSTLDWTPSGRAIPVTYTNRTGSTQSCQFKSADAGAVQLLQGAATATAGIPPLARLVVDVGESQIGTENELAAPVTVAPGESTSWLKMLLPGRAYGIYSRCTYVDQPQTIGVVFTFYPRLG